jgi:hypothetical protein
VVGVAGVVVGGVVVVGVVGVVVVGVVVVGVVVVVVAGFVVVVGVVVVVVGFVVGVVAFFSPQPASPKMSPTLNSTHMAATIRTWRFIAFSSPCLNSPPPGGEASPQGVNPSLGTGFLSDYPSRERCQVATTARPTGQVYPQRRTMGNLSRKAMGGSSPRPCAAEQRAETEARGVEWRGKGRQSG